MARVTAPVTVTTSLLPTPRRVNPPRDGDLLGFLLDVVSNMPGRVHVAPPPRTSPTDLEAHGDDAVDADGRPAERPANFKN